MNALKFFLVISLMILPQFVFADVWTHIELNNNGYDLKISYTKTYQAATYGSQGGIISGKAFVEVFSARPALVQRVEVYLNFNGQIFKTHDVNFTEDNSQHFWAQLMEGPTYAQPFKLGSTYLLRVTIDGKLVEFNFKMI